MVDNVQINAMSGGEMIAADDVNGVKVQRVKVGYGPDGAFSDVEQQAPLPTSVTPGASVGSDRIVVAVVGTPARLPTHSGIYGLTIRALIDNQDTVMVGGPSPGFELAPGDAVSLDVADSSAVFLDAVAPGDGVCLLWVSA